MARKKPAVEIPPILLEGDQPPPPPVQGPGQRYALGPTPAPVHGLEGEPGELPESYGTGQLFLMARDPEWVYAHWDLTRAQQMEFNRKSDDGHLVLRVYVDAVAGSPASETHVHPESRNWFVHVGRGGVRYVADLGYYDKQRRWQSVAVSKPTLTPPDALSEDTTVRFATLPAEMPFKQILEVVKEAAREHLPLAEAIREVAREKFKELGLAPALLDSAFAAEQTVWTPEQVQALAQLVSLDTVRRIWIGSLEVTELVRRHLFGQISSAQISQFAMPAAFVQRYLKGRVSAAQLQKPSEAGQLASPAGGFGGVSSPGGGPEVKQGFWFNLNAELIIYGATEPDATVTIGDRSVKLRSDGSFSCRFALPDGHYGLPVTAVSADQTEGRAAELDFSRQTAYWGEVGVHPQDKSLKPPKPENI